MHLCSSTLLRGILIGGRPRPRPRQVWRVGSSLRSLSYTNWNIPTTKMVAVGEKTSAGKKQSIPHIERTAHEPREKALIPVKIQKIEQINDKIRLFQLGIAPEARPVKFLPGQWLDVYCPSIPKAGGFTITSSPSKTFQYEDPYLELAVQKSPGNPPAAWLWGENPSQSAGRHDERKVEVLGQELQVRIGGSFTWPPPGLGEVELKRLEKVVFVAGGVGVNPLVSMVSYIAERCHQGEHQGLEVDFMYTVKDPGKGKKASEILFLERIAKVFEEGMVEGRLRLFLTGGVGEVRGEEGVLSEVLGKSVSFEGRRVTVEDVVAALGEKKNESAVYVCGVPGMTDEFVQKLRDPNGLGMAKERVLCEKWW